MSIKYLKKVLEFSFLIILILVFIVGCTSQNTTSEKDTSEKTQIPKMPAAEYPNAVFLVWIFILFVILLLILLLLIIQMFKSLKLKHSLTILAAILMLLTLAIVFRDDVTDIFMYQKLCMPNPSKDKVVIIIAENGIYDNDKISMQASKYFNSVKKDLNIDNADLRKFGGKTFHELDLFVEELYSKYDVGYIIFVGDDLPILLTETSEIINRNDTLLTFRFRNSKGEDKIHECSTKMFGCRDEAGTVAVLAGEENYIGRQLGCVNGDCDLNDCRDIGISYILPPLLYSDEEKVDFISKVLETYTNYHENFAELSKKYQKSLLHVADFSLIRPEKFEQHEEAGMGYKMPQTFVLNNESQKLMNELEKKNIVLFFLVHGTAISQQLIHFASDYEPGFESINPSTVEGWMNFSKKYGTPVLFVEMFSCGHILLRFNEEKHCCWPQIYMESGVWAYYGFVSVNNQGLIMERRISRDKTIGLAIRKGVIAESLVFGDILAHIE